MSHVRTQVADAVADLLEASPTDWGLVWKHRIAPQRCVTPYIQLWIEDEDINPLDIHPGYLQQRNMTLITRGRIRVVESEDNEKRIDDLAEELEQTITHADLKAELSNKVKFCKLQSITVDLSQEGDREFFDVSLVWEIQVHTTEGTPETLV